MLSTSEAKFLLEDIDDRLTVIEDNSITDLGGTAWIPDTEYNTGDIVYDVLGDTPYVAITTPVADVTTTPSQNLIGWKAITGTSGSMLIADYKFNTATSGDPGDGHCLVNNVDNTLADVLLISLLDEDGIDRGYGLETLSQGDYVSYRDKGNDPDTYIYRLSAAAIDHTTYFEVPVVHQKSIGSGGLNNNERMNIEVLYVPKEQIPELGGVMYRPTNEYLPGDIASYMDGPGLPFLAYICNFGTTGAFDANHWDVIAGQDEIGGRLWQPLTTYSFGDIVTDDLSKRQYYAIKENTGMQPSIDVTDTNWSLVNSEVGGITYNQFYKYEIGVIVTDPANGLVYSSLTDDNQSNEPNLSPTDWKLLDSSVKEYDVLSVYKPGDAIWITDVNRTTFKSTYRNDSIVNIGPEVFDATKWTQLSSSYENAYGLNTTQTGLFEGAEITKLSANEISISEGVGLIINDSNVLSPLTIKVDIPLTTLTLPDVLNEQYWIFSDNMGVIHAVTSKPTSGYFVNNIYLGFVSSDFINLSEIGLISDRPVTVQSLSKSVLGLHRYIAKNTIVGGGSLLGITGTLSLEINATEVYSYNSNFRTNPANPDNKIFPAQPLISFDYVDQNGVLISTANTTLDVVQYDDGGSLSAVNNNDASIQLLYFSPLNTTYYIMYGQEKYKDLQDAMNNRLNYAASIILPPKLEELGIFMGYIVVQADTVDITDTAFAIIETAAGSSISSGGAVPSVLNDLTDVTTVAPVNGDTLTFNSVSGLWENTPATGTLKVNLVAHAMGVGSPVKLTGSTWDRGKADTEVNLPCAIIISVEDVDNFTIQTSGIAYAPSHGFTIGSTYYTSITSSGTVTSTEPTTSGKYLHAAFIPLDANNISILPMLAFEI